MQFQDVVKHLENTQEFQSWRESHLDDFLAHIFVMFDEANRGTFQVGYYNPAENTVSTFIVSEEKIEVAPDQEVAKAPDQEIAPLDIAQVKASAREVLERAEDIRKEHYASYPIMKKFFLVQRMDDQQVYNMTYFTQQFYTINIKLDMDLMLVSHDAKPLADFSHE